MKKYVIGLDIGIIDETVAILAELKDGKLYIIKEKRSNGVGENKITKDQMKKIKEFYYHYKNDPRMKEIYKIFIPKILGWEEYDAEVIVE